MKSKGRTTAAEAEQRKKKIIDLYTGDQPMSLEEIGEIVGVSRQRIHQVLTEAGIEAQEQHEDISKDIQRICDLLNLKYSELGVILGVRIESISRWVNSRQFPAARYVRQIRLLRQSLEEAIKNRR